MHGQSQRSRLKRLADIRSMHRRWLACSLAQATATVERSSCRYGAEPRVASNSRFRAAATNKKCNSYCTLGTNRSDARRSSSPAPPTNRRYTSWVPFHDGEHGNETDVSKSQVDVSGHVTATRNHRVKPRFDGSAWLQIHASAPAQQDILGQRLGYLARKSQCLPLCESTGFQYAT